MIDDRWPRTMFTLDVNGTDPADGGLARISVYVTLCSHFRFNTVDIDFHSYLLDADDTVEQKVNDERIRG